MAREYPRLGTRCKLPHRPACALCEKASVYSVEVQVSWFRGDDEIRFVCEDHKKASARELMNPPSLTPVADSAVITEPNPPLSNAAVAAADSMFGVDHEDAGITTTAPKDTP